MFNSFHLQSECCPNYITLIPSLSCFNRSVVAIIPLLTGVSSKCFHFAKFILLSSISNRSVVVIDPYCSSYISFLTGVLCPFAQVLFALSSLATIFNRSAVWDLSYPLFHSFNSSGGSVLWFHQVSSNLIKFSLLPQLESCLKSFLPIVPFFQ